MLKKIEKLLCDLSTIQGLSGHEQAVAEYTRNKFKEIGLESTTDVIGNVYAGVKGRSNKLKVLLTAHMDQLGFVVRYITDKGFIKVDRVGGIPEKTLPSLRVLIKTENNEYVKGVIGNKSHHVTPPEEKYIVPKYTELFVDIGCNSREEVLALGINVGCPVTYRPYFEMMQNNRANGTSFDNRAALTALLILAEKFAKDPASCDVYFAGTVQEEYTIRGATLAARAVAPDIAICLDIATEGGTPGSENTSHVELGGGATMSLYNFHGRGTLNGTIPHPSLVKLFKETAKENNVPLQRTTLFGGLTELAYMQLEGKGIAGIDMCIPCRYTHTQVEVVDLNDIESIVSLVEKAIRNINDDFSLER